MALAERADLVARLTLDDRFSGRVAGVTAKLRGMEGSLSRIAGHASRGLQNAATNLAKVGVVAGGFVALNVRSGINSLAELEDATTSVDGAIKDLGLTGRITSREVAGWANEIESSVQAAFDDKEITAAATTLLRFGKVAPEALRNTLVVATDLASKTGDVGSAAEKLAKSLADPTKATRVLREVGVSLTEAEQDKIDAWVESGKLGQAQALILDKVARATKGAAAASKGEYRDALNTLTDTTEDAQRVLSVGFLPLLGRVSAKLRTAIADPATMARVREFGETLAGGFDRLLSIGERLPWAQIGDSLKLGATGAKAIFDVFTGLPPWVQTAVLTGWGLNKLTGGALGGIVGELGKGLIKGILGMNAGVVNINAGVVNGAGGAAAAAGGSRLGAAVGGGIVVAAAAQGVMDVATIAQGVEKGYQAGQQGDVQGVLDAQRDILDNIVMVPPGLKELGGIFANEQQRIVNEQKAAAAKITTRVEGMKGSMVQATQRAADRSTAAAERTKAAVFATTAAVRAIPSPKTTVNVHTTTRVSVTANSITRTMITSGTWSAASVGAFNHAPAPI